MKSFLTAAALVAAALPVACNKSPEGGNPGTRDTFRLSAPVLTKSMKQGETQKFEVKLNRGSEFRKSVALTTTAPTGLKAELPASVAASDADTVSLTVTVAADAPLGDAQPIVVTGTPEGGGVSTKVEVSIKVEAAK